MRRIPVALTAGLVAMVFAGWPGLAEAGRINFSLLQKKEATYKPGEKVVLPASANITDEILGAGFDESLSPFDSAKKRMVVVPDGSKKVNRSAARSYESVVELLSDQMQISAYVTAGILSASASSASDHRYAVVRVNSVERTSELQLDQLDFASEAKLVATKITWGWGYFVTADGSASNFSAEVAGEVLGFGGGVEEVQKSMSLDVQAKARGLTPKVKGSVVPIDDEKGFAENFLQDKVAVPLFVEYTVLKEVPVRSVSWESDKKPIVAGRAVIAAISLKVSPTDKHGKSWDTGAGALPDLHASIVVDGKQVDNCTGRNDRLELACSSGKDFEVTPKSEVRIDVYDKDLMADDKIGSATITGVLGKEYFRKLPMPGDDLIKEASIIFRPVTK